MKKIIVLSILLSSTLAFAGVGDVYDCITENFVGVTQDDVERYKSEKFVFRWTETLIIYSGGYKDRIQETITQQRPSQEKFEALFKPEGLLFGGITMYSEGKMVHMNAHSSIDGANILIANCKKF